MIEFIGLPDMLTPYETEIKNWLNVVATNHGYRLKELQYHFVGKKVMLEVNIKHLNHDFDTDVITFDYSGRDIIRGEVFLNKDFIESSAVSLEENVDYEYLRILVHGLLHLCGFDDTSRELKSEMTKEEDIALSLQTFLKSKFHVEQ